MKIDAIQLVNFRCFENIKVKFAPGVNAFFGRNGAGKSTLLDALALSLSAFFSRQGYRHPDYNLYNGISTLNIRSYSHDDIFFNRKERREANFVSINMWASLVEGQPAYNIFWEMAKENRDRASIRKTGYRDAARDFISYCVQAFEMPLLAYFSDSFPHHATKMLDVGSRIANEINIPRNFGYFQWDDRNACVTVWERRFINMLVRSFEINHRLDNLPGDAEEEKKSIIEDNKVILDESRCIQQALVRFSRLLPDRKYHVQYFSAQLSGSRRALYLGFGGGRESKLEYLPTGYRRLFSIALDILYRSWILNRNTDPEGIVIIDEIDLHLHPELEQNVIAILTQTFPRLQFIVSTHSPLVITNIDRLNSQNAVFSFASYSDAAESADDELPMHAGPVRMNNVFGLDYLYGLTELMNVSPRTSEVKSLRESYAMFMKHGLVKPAQDIADRLKKYGLEPTEEE